MKTTTLTFWLILITTTLLFSQDSKRTNIWYFGTNAGIDFNNTPPTPLSDGALNISEGCATICNTSGELMIYTDGRTIWNRNHDIIPDAINLGGDESSTQSGIIVPVPNSDDLLYVFSVDAKANSGGLRYAEINMNLNNGLGGLVSSNNILLSVCTEKITAIPHHNKQDFWLIAHEYQSNNFVVWKITNSGISSSSITSIGSAHSGDLITNLGYMKSSPDGSRLALAVQGANFVELFDFNNQTGEISNPIHFANHHFNNPYGIEFSPDGTRLYIAERRDNPLLFQVNIDLPTSQEMQNSLIVIAEGSSDDFGAIQNAPDGKMYIAKKNSNYLSVIHNPNELGTSCNFIEDNFYLGGQQSVLGLPNLIPGFFIPEPNIQLLETMDYCNGTADIQVVAEIESSNVVLQWYYNNTLIPNQTSTQIQVSTSGTYELKVLVYLDNQENPSEYTRQINISLPAPVSINDFELDHPLCGVSNGTISIIGSGGTPPYQYSFDDGATFQTSNTLSNLRSGVYHIVLQDSNGCTTNETVELIPTNPPQISDIQVVNTSCNLDDGELIITTLHETEQLEYSINGIDYQEDHVFSNLTSGIYTVSIKDEHDCISTNEVEVANPPELIITSLERVAAVCEENNGGVSIKVDGGTGSIQVALNGDNFQSNFAFEGLSSGRHDIQVIDEAECSTSTSFFIPEGKCPIYVPNAFSPNNDGSNDLFQIYPHPDFKGEFKMFKIFDRWGANIFEARNFNPTDTGWDGTYRGKALATGVYLYFVEYISENGNTEIIQGDITIIK